jgi:hypothetical protein
MSSGRPFEPGNKFGRGRPKGSKNKSTNSSQELIEGFGPLITTKCISDFERTGNNTSKVILMRELLKEKPKKFKMGPTNTPEECLKRYDDVLQGVSKGKIKPQEGEIIGRILEGKLKAITIVELAARVEALEAGKVREKQIQDNSTTRPDLTN